MKLPSAPVRWALDGRGRFRRHRIASEMYVTMHLSHPKSSAWQQWARHRRPNPCASFRPLYGGGGALVVAHEKRRVGLMDVTPHEWLARYTPATGTTVWGTPHKEGHSMGSDGSVAQWRS